MVVQGGKVRIQEGLLSGKLLVALQNVAGVKVLQFSTMKNTFKNFTAEADFKK